ncbi:MAG: peptide chain release factor N(5)-glutamine methyltransferase, partial [Pseudomonadota bacterium]
MAPPESVQALLKAGVVALRAAGQHESAELDARTLLAAALQMTPNRLLLELDSAISPELGARFHTMVSQRISQATVARIIGRRAFWSHDFQITDATLDPRPDTETLITHALEILRQDHAPPNPRILDLGTGTGCILISLLSELPSAVGTGTDLSPEALAVAQGNAVSAGVAARASLVQSDWFESVIGAFDLIISNPPYIPSDDIATLMPDVRQNDPHLALDGGADGLDAYRAIIAGAPMHLDEGWLIL